MVKKIFGQMLLTQIVSSVTVMICMLVDSILIGRYLGINAMTAYGLTSPLLLVFVSLGTILSNGIQVICGKRIGCGDKEGTNACFTLSVLTAGVVAGAGLIIVLVFCGPICTLLGAGNPVPDNEVYFLTKNYLLGFIIGAPAFIFAKIMVPYMQLSGNRLRLVVAVAALTVGDIVFDLLNVFVFHGGILGMGIASSLSYYIAFFIGGAYFVKKNCLFQFTKAGLSRKLLGELIHQAIPTVVNQISCILLAFCMNRLLLAIDGNLAVAAYSVISTLGNFCYCVGSGIGAVAMTLGAIFYGDEDRESLYTVVRTMVQYALRIISVVVLVILIFAPRIVALFLADNPEAVSLAATGLRLFSLSLFFSPINVAFKYYYQGVHRNRFAEMIAFLSSFLLPVLFSFVLSRFLQTTGIWLGWVCGEAMTLLVTSLLVWSRNRKISLQAEAYAMLPAAFGARREDCLDLSVHTADEAMQASEQASVFCREHDLDERSCLLIPLCIEEMVMNIVDHGFTKDERKDHSIEVRLMLKEEKRMIRIRDNCVNFDPVSYVKLHEDDDPTAHFGIRMIMKMVTDANYVSSLGLNNLTLVM